MHLQQWGSVKSAFGKKTGNFDPAGAWKILPRDPFSFPLNGAFEVDQNQINKGRSNESANRTSLLFERGSEVQ